MKINNRDYLFLIWKDPKTRKNYSVGELSKNGKYEFRYGHEIDEAIKNGFELLIPFEDKDAVYTNDILFPLFSSRLPDKKRRDIKDILEKYGLEEYDEYQFLKKSGARLPIDTLEFIDPIDITMYENDNNVIREFYVAGTRYYMECNGVCCEEAKNLKINEKLDLVFEPTNIHDENAVKIEKKDGSLLGYLPRYYAKGFIDFINRGFKYECNVVEYNKDNVCGDCVKVKLVLFKL